MHILHVCLFFAKRGGVGGGGGGPPTPFQTPMYGTNSLCFWPLMLSDVDMIILVNMWLMDWNLGTCV